LITIANIFRCLLTFIEERASFLFLFLFLFIYLFIYLFLVPELELRGLHLPGKHFTAWAIPHSFLAFGAF
jgi:hypothetical protein